MTLDEFLKTFQKYQDVRDCRRPQHAFSSCAYISKWLVEDAQALGFDAEMIRLEGETWELRQEAWCRNRGMNPYTEWCHHIAKINGEYLDYTWRQFFPQSEFPIRQKSLDFWQNHFENTRQSAQEGRTDEETP